MNNLAKFFAQHNHWFLFVALEVLGFVLLFRGNSYQGSAWFSTASTVVGKVYEWESELTSFFRLRQVNEKLEARNVELEQEVQSLLGQLAEATADTSLYAHAPAAVPAGIRYIQAKVVSNSVNERDNFITVNRGEKDGVRPNMGVVSGNGVVGIVYLTGPHYSIVIPILHSKSHISCSLYKRDFFGYLSWDGKTPLEADLDDVPRHARFRKGNKVVTCGYSGVFPPGLPVGTVAKAYNSRDGRAYRLRVRLSTDFASLRDVTIIDNSAQEERIELLRAAKDSLKIK